MKFRSLLEGRGVSKYTVSVEWTLTDHKTDEEYDIEITCEVEAEDDPYGTGDSPTLYEVEIVGVRNMETNEEIDPKAYQASLTHKELDRIYDLAIARIGD